MPGQLGGLAAEERAAGVAADLRRPLDELGDLVELDPVGGDVVEEEQRLGSGREHVVDAVSGEVGAARAQRASLAGEHELRADAVGRGCEQSPVVQRVQPRERAEALRSGGLDGRPQPARRPRRLSRARPPRPRTSASPPEP